MAQRPVQLRTRLFQRELNPELRLISEPHAYEAHSGFHFGWDAIAERRTKAPMTNGKEHNSVILIAGAFEDKRALDSSIGIDDEADTDIQVVDLHEGIRGGEGLWKSVVGAGGAHKRRGQGRELRNVYWDTVQILFPLGNTKRRRTRGESGSPSASADEDGQKQSGNDQVPSKPHRRRRDARMGRQFLFQRQSTKSS